MLNTSLPEVPSIFQTCPPFFTAKIETGMPVIESLREGFIREIGRSVRGQPILAIEYGDFEPLEGITSDNLHSSLAARLAPPDATDIFPEGFYGTNRRSKPSLILQGGIHGGELSGTVASINLCSVIETGCDLRGKPWPRLQELARATRIAIIPWLNPDAVNRWPFYQNDNAPSSLLMAYNNGIARDGSVLQYPQFKNLSRINPDDMLYLGSYFNDNGINLQYDFLTIDRQPETLAWMRYYLQEKPDAVLIWHCNGGSLLGPCGYYLPVGYQHLHSRLAGAVLSRLKREGLLLGTMGRLSWGTLPGTGKPEFNQSAAVYHNCGALPLLSEMPQPNEHLRLNCDQILDIGLVHIEEVLEFGHTEGYRPYEYRAKLLRTGEIKQP